jgi:G:T-mismatch repair DNA endonuclease (very short patch repair protein)
VDFLVQLIGMQKNTNRVDKAMKTNEQKKKLDPTHNLQPVQIDYWIVRHGMTREEAKKKVSERQTTNSLEAFINRANGDVEEGKRMHGLRQEKWLNTLESRGWFGNHSEVSGKLFTEVQKHILDKELLFGDRELSTKIGNKVLKPDCSIVGSKKIIEFFGDYWHANPKKYSSKDTVRRLDEGSYITAQEIWDRDAARLTLMKKYNYDVLVIWEQDYAENPQAIIESCIKHFSG